MVRKGKSNNNILSVSVKNHFVKNVHKEHVSYSSKNKGNLQASGKYHSNVQNSRKQKEVSNALGRSNKKVQRAGNMSVFTLNKFELLRNMSDED